MYSGRNGRGRKYSSILEEVRERDKKMDTQLGGGGMGGGCREQEALVAVD